VLWLAVGRIEGEPLWLLLAEWYDEVLESECATYGDRDLGTDMAEDGIG